MIDVQTPWREPYADLVARHVGRAQELQAITNAIERWQRGERPHPIYLYGPRGAGKSHLLSLVMGALREAPELALRVLHVPDDVPVASSADELLRRIDAADRRRFVAPPSAPVLIDHAIVLLEGLDRHLHAMGPAEQKALRHAWAAGSWLLIGAGCSYPDAFRSSSAAFYHAFSVWPLHGMTDDEASALLDRLAGPAAATHPAWPARRAALIRLGGGNPRALMTLGAASREAPAADVSDVVLAAVRRMSASYVDALRREAPQHQRVLEAMVRSPVELSAPQLGHAAGIDPTSAAKACARMREEGVLLDRRDQHVKTWRVADPLFRAWYEYRTMPWAESRTALLTRLSANTSGHPPVAADAASPTSAWEPATPRGEPMLDAATLNAMIADGADLHEEQLLSWAAALPHVSDAVADAFIAAVAALPPRQLRAPPHEALSALLRLGRIAPERWAKVRSAMSAAAPWAQDLAYHTQTLLDLQASPQPTHVEIQAVLDALAATASPPRSGP